jgi:tetratricopeptide (TPR) repeat protein
MTISFTLVDFRFTTLIAAAFLLLVSIRTLQCSGSDQGFLKKLIAFITPEQITPLVSGIILSAMLLVVWWIYRDALGFEASSSFIGRTLSAQQQTEHFRIHYAPASFTKEEMQWAAAEHEFRFHQVETALQVKFPGLIDSYIYPDSDTKRRFIGTGTTNIAKPWRKEIHLNKDSWQSTLKHELVHVVAGEFGMPVIHAHYHTGLVEGLATAIDGDWGNRTLHEYAAAMKKFELVRSPAHLITPLGFAMQSSSLSYVMMGSFCKFLLNRYGLIRFKELYGGKSIEVVYGKSYEQLVDEWQHFIERVRVPEDWQEHVEFYFKRPSIFAKECARAIAKMNDDGWRQLAKNNSSSAMQEFSRSLHASWNTEAFSGFVRSAYQAAQYDTVIQLMNKQLQDSLQRNSILNLMLIYGDALWYKGDVLSARKAYKNILTLDLSERYNEAASSRLAAMNDKELGVALPGFFVGTLSDSAAIDLLTDLEKHNGHILLPYIKAKILFRMKNYGEAGQELDGATTSFGISILDESKEQLLGEIFFRQKKFQSARLHFWQSLNYISNEASIQRVDDWLERCEWYEGNKFTTN